MSFMVRTHAGSVQGGSSGGARHWLGIPYAKAERFGLPLAPPACSETRDATRFGPECPQSFGAFATDKKITGKGVSEDCLVLNIWAPDTADDTPKAVMVWIHGGAFMAGTGNIYDGAHLAAGGDIVVVTINYRLGILGFVNLGDVIENSGIPSNLGMRDQIAALQWVRDNIAAFGGDPQRVTLAGESAGSISVAMLMICPGAQSLFHGAILESGTISLPHSLDTSRRIGRRYCQALELQPGDAAKLRTLDLKTLLKSQAVVHAAEVGNVPAAPWFDGELFPATLAAARVAPSAAVPLLAGFNREEIRAFELSRGPAILPMTRAANQRLVRAQLSAPEADQVMAAYPDTQHDNRALATHLTFGMPTLHFAERQSLHSPTWFYRFDYAHFLVGAAHAIELAFVWDLKGPLGWLLRGGFAAGKRRALSERMRQHWTHFVKYGRPQQDWPGYSAGARWVRLFNFDDEMVEDPDGARRVAWNGADLSTSGAGRAGD